MRACVRGGEGVFSIGQCVSGDDAVCVCLVWLKKIFVCLSKTKILVFKVKKDMCLIKCIFETVRKK